MEFDLQVSIKAASVLGAGLAVGLGAIGAAIGEGFAAGQANQAIARNPKLSGEVFKTMLIGQAITESAAIFALVVALVLIFSQFANETYLTVWATFGAGLCMGLGALGSGIGAGYPVAATCRGIVRQPAVSSRLNTTMLIGSAICQTPSIFALVISFILLFSGMASRPISPTWAALLGASLATGLSAMGAGLGSGSVAQAGCEGVARQPTSATVMSNVMLLGQAITQSTAIYGLLIGFVLIFKVFPESTSLSAAFALLGAGICMGLGAIGPAIGEGITASKAVNWISRNPSAMEVITRTMLVGMAVAESTGIYSMVIALVLVFVV
jgi:F-type H+-transporting ATPase subunit c